VSASGSGRLEREIKLAAPPGFTVPDLAGVAPGIRVEIDTALDLDATYVDTADLRLVRAGVSLRRRTGEGSPRWTLKLPSGDQASGLSRREFDVDVVDDDEGHEVPASLATLVTGWVRSAPLVPVIVIRSHRERLLLVDADGRELAEVDDDEVTVVDDGEEVARFREIEVEMAGYGSAELLRMVADALVAAGAGAPDPTSKVVRALGPRAQSPSGLAGPDLDPGSTIAEVVAAALRSSVATIVGADHVIRLDDLDPDHDGVRRARSAVRRLRSDLETLAPVLDPQWVEALRSATKELGELLGTVRSTDGLVERLLRAIGALAAEERKVATGVVHHLEERRRDEVASLLSLLCDDRYVALLEELVAAGESPRLLEEGDVAAAGRLPELVRHRWTRLGRAVEHLGPEPDDDSLLRVRSLARRARHASELAAPVVGSPASLLARSLGGLQDVLGGFHHATDAEAWLREVMPALGPDERAVAEALAALQHVDVAAARSRWHDAWAACDTEATTEWLG
jgi:CHAD domain-containing protein